MIARGITTDKFKGLLRKPFFLDVVSLIRVKLLVLFRKTLYNSHRRHTVYCACLPNAEKKMQSNEIDNASLTDDAVQRNINIIHSFFNTTN